MREITNDNNFYTWYYCYLTGTARCHIYPADATSLGRDSRRQGGPKWPQIAIQTQLTDKSCIARRPRGDLLSRQQDTDRDRQIQAGAVLGDISR
jgi:hypothetical protein